MINNTAPLPLLKYDPRYRQFIFDGRSEVFCTLGDCYENEIIKNNGLLIIEAVNNYAKIRNTLHELAERIDWINNTLKEKP